MGANEVLHRPPQANHRPHRRILGGCRVRTRPTRRVSASTVAAVDRIAQDLDGLARVLQRRVGHARRWDPQERPAPRRYGPATASEGEVAG